MCYDNYEKGPPKLSSEPITVYKVVSRDWSIKSKIKPGMYVTIHRRKRYKLGRTYWKGISSHIRFWKRSRAWNELTDEVFHSFSTSRQAKLNWYSEYAIIECVIPAHTPYKSNKVFEHVSTFLKIKRELSVSEIDAISLVGK